MLRRGDDARAHGRLRRLRLDVDEVERELGLGVVHHRDVHERAVRGRRDRCRAGAGSACGRDAGLVGHGPALARPLAASAGARTGRRRTRNVERPARRRGNRSFAWPRARRSSTGGSSSCAGGPDAVLLLHGLTGSHVRDARTSRARLARGGHALPRAGDGGPRRRRARSPRRALAGVGREGAPRARAGSRARGARSSSAARWARSSRAPSRTTTPSASTASSLLAPALELAAPRTPRRAARRPRARSAGSSSRRGRLGRPRSARCASETGTPRSRACRSRAVAELRALARARGPPVLPGIAAPALVVAGAHDHTVTLARGAAARAPDRQRSGASSSCSRTAGTSSASTWSATSARTRRPRFLGLPCPVPHRTRERAEREGRRQKRSGARSGADGARPRAR